MLTEVKKADRTSFLCLSVLGTIGNEADDLVSEPELSEEYDTAVEFAGEHAEIVISDHEADSSDKAKELSEKTSFPLTQIII